MTTKAHSNIMRSVAYMMRVPSQPSAVHEAAQLLGNTLRLAILNLLREGPFSRAYAADRLGVNESNLSRQLSILAEHDLVTAEMMPGRGRPMLYAINEEAVETMLTLVGNYVRGLPLDRD